MIGIIIGTGPSLSKQKSTISALQCQGALLFGVNNTFNDFDLDCWIACDPKWHEHYGQVKIRGDCWHWDRGICQKFGYRFIEGRWQDGISTDKNYLSLNHGSGPQALNLAAHYGCNPILLAGHDFNDEGKRHYFDDLSETPGEYPAGLRKFSKFIKKNGQYDMATVYQKIADQEGRPEIFNSTQGSALTAFAYRPLEDFLCG